MILFFYILGDIVAAYGIDRIKSAFKTFEDAKSYDCSKCSKSYKYLFRLCDHQIWECGKEPQFICNCGYKTHYESNLKRHANSNRKYAYKCKKN